MPGGGWVAVEPDVGGSEMCERAQPPCHFLVREFVNELGRVITVRLRLFAVAGHRAAPGSDSERCSEQGAVTEQCRCGHGALCPTAHRLVIAGVEPVDAELDHQLDGLR
jgi:hypothetical protein